MTEATAPRICANPRCGNTVTPRQTRFGPQRVYCSPGCWGTNPDAWHRGERAQAVTDPYPKPGRFTVTVRIERPDGQFITATRTVPDNLLAPGAGADEGIAQDWAVREIGSAFVAAYRRAAELPD